MHVSLGRLFSALILVSLLIGQTAQAEVIDKSIEKVVKSVLTTIRYGKDDLAIKRIDFDKMAEISMGDHWKKVTSTDRKKLSFGIKVITRKTSFPKGREIFKHLDAILYGAPRIKGEKANLKTTIVIHRDYKKQEMVIDFVLYKQNNIWKIVDTVILGESTLEALYEDQIEPLIEAGGIPAVMAALDAKLKTVQK